jgi:threonine dehydrogenase-like Zn-dependent dehydrogenase
MSMTPTSIPQTQHAIQLVGPGKLALNTQKPVHKPGPRQVLAKVEVVGLCFSDLKLLKQFSAHARKSEIVRGIEKDALAEIPSYVPGEKPTVPGHELCVELVAVGGQAKRHKPGERCLVQTDYRDLPTAGSNAAFGYNFEGGLQEYVLMDERVIIDKTGKRFLIPVGKELSASAVALVEPWACVEHSYVVTERQTPKAGGRLLVVAERGHATTGLMEAYGGSRPASVTAVCPEGAPEVDTVDGLPARATDVASLPNESFDDIIYFGARKQTIEVLNDKLAACGIINIVTGGKRIGEPVSVGVGRVHYGLTRWIGTMGANAAESYRTIPATAEIRTNDEVVVIGAGGPMGQMHVVRCLCSGIPGVSVTGTDIDDGRLTVLQQKVQALMKSQRVALRVVNTQKAPLQDKFTYFALMAPVGILVANAVRDAKRGAIINIFAGIPAPTRQNLDLDTYIGNGLYMTGASGSEIRDMEIVLRKVETGQLDTNCSVDAVSGMAGAADGIAAVENRTLAGKILVYPRLHELGLVPLAQLAERFPTVAAKLNRGIWTKAAEEELLKVAK